MPSAGRQPFHRLCQLALTGLLGLWAEGCATLHPSAYRAPVPEPLRRAALRVDVVPAPTLEASPHLEGRIGRGSGTGRGAASGAAGGALAGLQISLQTGPFGVILAPILIPVSTLLGAAGGGAIGFAQAIPEAEGRAMRAALDRNQADLSGELARRVTALLPLGVTREAAAPADLRLEVSILSWGLFGGAGAHPRADLRLTARYRVLKADGSTVLVRDFTLGGPLRPFAEWAAEDGGLLKEALDQVLARVSEAITEGAFLLHDFHVSGLTPMTCGLSPRSPGPVFMAALPIHGATPMVDSLCPLLVWEAFPRGADQEGDSGKLLDRLSEVRYDLRIWTSVGGGPGPLVYERLGLDLPVHAEGGSSTVEHRLDLPLSPGREYLWSVRARFKLDGQERATRWSMNQDPDARAQPASKRWFGPTLPHREPCLNEGIPPLRHHRFRTP